MTFTATILLPCLGLWVVPKWDITKPQICVLSTLSPSALTSLPGPRAGRPHLPVQYPRHVKLGETAFHSSAGQMPGLC